VGRKSTGSRIGQGNEYSVKRGGKGKKGQVFESSYLGEENPKMRIWVCENVTILRGVRVTKGQKGEGAGAWLLLELANELPKRKQRARTIDPEIKCS